MASDVDDWSDLLQFISLPSLKPAGLIVDHYVAYLNGAADTRSLNAAKLFIDLAGKTVPAYKGSNVGITYGRGGVVTLPSGIDYTAADFILNTMQNSPEKVRIITAGSLRDVAIALAKNPTLFKSRIDSVYISAGRMGGNGSINFNYDRAGARFVMNADIPIVYIDNASSHSRLTGPDEAALNQLGDRSAAFESYVADIRGTPNDLIKLGRIAGFSRNRMSNMLRVLAHFWRDFKGKPPRTFLTDTKQHAPDAPVSDSLKGRNQWDNPIYMHASGQNTAFIPLVRGDVSMYIPNPNNISASSSDIVRFTADPLGSEFALRGTPTEVDTLSELSNQFYKDVVHFYDRQ